MKQDKGRKDKLVFELKRRRDLILVVVAVVTFVVVCWNFRGEEIVGFTLPETFVSGREFYVSPDGSELGSGTQEQPWSLAYAFSQAGGAIEPGDVVWLMEGVYPGGVELSAQGEEHQPIIFQAVPQARVVIDGGEPVIRLLGATWVDLRGLELTNHEMIRDFKVDSTSASGIMASAEVPSKQVRVIDCVIHDVAGMGIDWGQGIENSLVYGSLVFNNGTTGEDPGIWVGGVSGISIVDSVVFNNASYGVYAYGLSDSAVKNVLVEGSLLFNNGSIGYVTQLDQYAILRGNLVVGGKSTPLVARILRNTMYTTEPLIEQFGVGVESGIWQAVVANNVVRGGSVGFHGDMTKTEVVNNSLYAPGAIIGLPKEDEWRNTWLPFRPSQSESVVRVDQFDESRAFVAVFNWRRANQVLVPATRLGDLDIRVGDRYTIRAVQNYFGNEVSGVYQGGGIVVPMTGWKVAQPVGLPFKPTSTFPDFGVFEVRVRK